MIDYSELYYSKEIKVENKKIAAFPIELSVEIRDFNGTPDCKVGHFGYNFYFRTNAGLKAKAYKTEKNLERGVERLLTKNGFEVIGWV